ncbi:hypothetical protein ACWEFJ_18950 [Actinosynnema sp. NPDC004786]
MSVPPVFPAVVADVLDALPPRLRKRVDASLGRVAEWTVTVDGGTARATLDAETTVTWTLRDGVLTAADDLVCGCLLAPKCLHRGLAVAAAEVADGVPEPVVAEPVAEVVGTPITEDERAAAAVLWAACATVLRAGATGSGAVVRAELLRAVHTARVAGLHRAAADGLRVAATLAAARSGDPSFDREALTAELVELMLLCHDLRTGAGEATEVRGTARREYRPIGSLRLYGLCTEVVVAGSGYAGVVTHLVDDGGALWTVPAIMPGGAERVAAAANGPVAIGESGLSHRELGRAGLLLSGGTASPDHRLGAGKAVRAVAASAASWEEPPFAELWARPLPDQVARAFDAAARPDSHRPAGADLLFVAGTVSGAAGEALRVDVGGIPVDLVGDGDRPRENLRVLAGAPGLRVRAVARLLPDRPGTAVALAVAGDLDLPDEVRHHVDLGLDRLQRSHVAGGGTRGLPPRREPADGLPRPAPADSLPPPADRVPQPESADRLPPPEPADRAPRPESADRVPQPESADRVPLPEWADRVPRPESADREPRPEPADRLPRPEPAGRVPRPVRPLENVLHRVALGGRAVAAVASIDREVTALARNGLTATADLLAGLADASRDRGRDAFGRVIPDEGDDFPLAWLRAGLHVREFTRAAARRAWLAAVEGDG